jgi:hypothetical protein
MIMFVSCSADPVSSAIAWEQDLFKHEKAPYAGLCLFMVRDAYKREGITPDYLDGPPNAREATAIAKKHPRWNHFTSYTDIPAGGVAFWSDCSSLGHVVLSIGNGHAVSNGDGRKWDGSPDVSFEWLSTVWCPGKPDGWILPDKA